MSKRRKGILLLTEGRSGSTWLGSLAFNARLGKSEEWLDPNLLGVDPYSTDAETYFETALQRASEGCAGFYVKIFPRHLYEMQDAFGVDFITYCRRRHDIALLALTRDDRLRQAISFARARQSQQWTTRKNSQREPEYDFQEIARCLFMIGRSYSFWDDYTKARDLEVARFVYEALVKDPKPFLAHIANFLGVSSPDEAFTELRVQRDNSTEEWLSRFAIDAVGHSFLDAAAPERPARSRKALLRLLRKQYIRLPYSY
ncbi:Stf0 family sulfotransferase [Thioclava sp. UBA3469]|uniref:Stf0 family sulfotransferase n=1 Tax=Thioclava sp. UBA3469 TaxID=1947693 RepID=UPI000C4ABFBA|nr:Stf0 family sulfotransferase [Thioclava sp. UBA3469]MAQ36089.1 LpsS [Thioclava sp.]